MNLQAVDRWRNIHRFCNDEPGPIVSLDEARYVLGEHSDHGPGCLQYLAALSRASEVAA
ncbi:hypothetical protein [Nocardia spumae]|uniref:hypothetical protein n=1 Tax=Nocardia spumae TaxID=2887190 RepID=UPI001D15CB3B|nr:hypothetical protein [Nocardia spumae]